MSKIFRIHVIGFVALFTVSAQGLENENDEKYFLDACVAFLSAPETAQAQVCSDFIHGFLEGARIVESLFIAHLEAEHNESEGFTHRAFRTRVGKPDSADLERPSAPFCMPDDAYNADIIERLVDRLPSSVSSLDEMEQRFFEALKLEYPCT